VLNTWTRKTADISDASNSVCVAPHFMTVDGNVTVFRNVLLSFVNCRKFDDG